MAEKERALDIRLLHFDRKSIRIPDDWIAFLGYNKAEKLKAYRFGHAIVIQSIVRKCAFCQAEMPLGESPFGDLHISICPDCYEKFCYCPDDALQEEE